uniref:Flavastacin n=3 Tax=Lygus hesperus TaxID=30085 RepID=A0A0A9YLM7_LYGHE
MAGHNIQKSTEKHILEPRKSPVPISVASRDEKLSNHESSSSAKLNQTQSALPTREKLTVVVLTSLEYPKLLERLGLDFLNNMETPKSSGGVKLASTSIDSKENKDGTSSSTTTKPDLLSSAKQGEPAKVALANHEHQKFTAKYNLESTKSSSRVGFDSKTTNDGHPSYTTHKPDLLLSAKHGVLTKVTSSDQKPQKLSAKLSPQSTKSFGSKKSFDGTSSSKTLIPDLLQSAKHVEPAKVALAGHDHQKVAAKHSLVSAKSTGGVKLDSKEKQ